MLGLIDLGMSELLIVGVVALIVVGPKDLPGMFRTLGRLTAKVRAMGREFTRAMEDAADESGVKDVATGLKAATNPTQFGLDKVKDAAKSVTDWHPEDEIGHILPPKKAEMSEERKEMAKKISDNAAKVATERLEKEKAAAQASAEAEAKPAAKKTAAKKAPAKKPAAKKTTAAKKPAAKTAKKAAPKKKDEDNA